MTCPQKTAFVFSHAAALILTVLLCAACSKNPAPETSAQNSPQAPEPAAPQATGLVKNPVKLSDTADAVKWMDMASTKSPAQIAKEEKLAKDARDARLAAEARDTREARAAADAKALVDAKLAADARELAARARETKVAAVQPLPVVPLVSAPVTPPEPVLKVLFKEQPKYPKEAQRDGVMTGMVTAQVHVDVDGKVSSVDILTARPKKYFDKAVIAAALQWKYAPISKPVTTTLEFNFRIDGDGS